MDARISGPLAGWRRSPTRPDRYALSGVKLKAGNSDLSGDATLAMGGARPAITANFSSTQVDLAAAHGAARRQGEAGAAPSVIGRCASRRRCKERRIFSDDPLPFDLINASDGEMRYHADKVLAKGRRSATSR